MTDPLKYIEKDDYGTILLNRPEKRNAITLEMAKQFVELMTEIETRPIKFLILKSAGEKSFCAGGDLHQFHSDLTEKEAYAALNTMKQVLMKLVMFHVPVICLLQANAFGGGCELATACDFRIAKEKTSFGFVQTNLGILPGWGGGALLYHKVHPSFAFHWITEDEIYPADLLYQKGWLHRIVSRDNWHDEARILAPYMKKSYEQMTFIKKQYKETLGIPKLFEKMEEESINSARLWGSPTHKKALEKFFLKR